MTKPIELDSPRSAGEGFDAAFDGPPFADTRWSADRPAARPGSGGGLRLDIQGLRAVAVLAVIVNHLTSHPQGAFVGVDVFFVISGFLITGVLLRQAERRGRVSFLEFYRARARRILPAALVTLAACWLAAHLIFRGERITQTVTDLEWALGFAANIHFQRVGTDYFQANGSPSPVQHFWSLAVEEQFYLVWPVVILLVLTAVRPLVRNRQNRLTLLLGLVLAGSTLSFVRALHESASNTTTAYFSTLDRAWELGVGAALAVLLTRFPAAMSRLRWAAGPLSLLGVLVIGVSLFIVAPGPRFPAPMGALPVLATALTIAAGSAGNGGWWTAVLTNRVAGYIGLVSFSAYLWHYPVIIFAEAVVPKSTTIFYPMVVLLIVGVTMFSYHVVEAPFRDLAFRERSEGARSRDPKRSQPVVLAFTCAVTALALFSLRADPKPPNFVSFTVADPSSDDGTSSEEAPDPHLAPVSTTLAAQITASLQATSFPSLNPGLDAIGLTAALHDWKGCNTDDQLEPTCVFRPAHPKPNQTAVVLGDSTGLAWLPAVETALLPAGWTVEGLSRQECSAADIQQTGLAAGVAAGCDQLHAAYPRLIAALHPQLIFLSSVETTPSSLRDGKSGVAATEEYEAGLYRTIQMVSGPGRRIIVLSPPPKQKALLDCDTLGATPADCVGSPNPSWYQLAAADQTATARAKVTYLDTRSWFCSSTNYCPAFVGNVPVRYDQVHLTKAYATALGSELAAAVLPP